MKTPLALISLSGALASALPATAADRPASSTLPAHLALMNYSPSFAHYSGDVTLLAAPLNVRSNSGSLTFVPKSGDTGAEGHRPKLVPREDADKFRFNFNLSNPPASNKNTTPSALPLFGSGFHSQQPKEN